MLITATDVQVFLWSNRSIPLEYRSIYVLVDWGSNDSEHHAQSSFGWPPASLSTPCSRSVWEERPHEKLVERRRKKTPWFLSFLIFDKRRSIQYVTVTHDRLKRKESSWKDEWPGTLRFRPRQPQAAITCCKGGVYEQSKSIWRAARALDPEWPRSRIWV